jgi:hypothetical protein
MPTTLTHGAFSGAAPTTAATTAARPGFGRRLWRFLIEMGARRAEPHILMLAAQVELTDPELARQMRQHVRHGLLD